LHLLLPSLTKSQGDKRLSSHGPTLTPEAFVNKAVSSGDYQAMADIISKSNKKVAHHWNIDVTAPSLRTLIESGELNVANDLLCLAPKGFSSADVNVDRALERWDGDLEKAHVWLRQGYTPIKRELIFLNDEQPYTQARMSYVDGQSDFITSLCQSLKEEPATPRDPDVCFGCRCFLMAGVPVQRSLRLAELEAAS
jgi:hypothetical protein